MTPESEQKLHVFHHFAGGVYAKEMTLATLDDCMHQHQHHYDHMSILASGKIILDVDGVKTEHTAPAVVHIAAHKRHWIVPVEAPVKWFCIHRTDVTDPAAVDDDIVSSRG